MKNASRPCRAALHQGFTLIELTIAVALVAVLAGIALPNLNIYIQNSRVRSTASELLRTFQTARTEAIKRQKNIVVCMSANPTAATPTCSTSNIKGWIAFQDDVTNNWDHDSTEELVDTHAFESAKLYLRADNSMKVSFATTGFANLTGGTSSTTPMTAIVLCDSRGNQGGATLSAARGLDIVGTGRARMTQVVSEITTLLGTGRINGTCPP